MFLYYPPIVINPETLRTNVYQDRVLSILRKGDSEQTDSNFSENSSGSRKKPSHISMLLSEEETDETGIKVKKYTKLSKKRLSYKEGHIVNKNGAEQILETTVQRLSLF